MTYAEYKKHIRAIITKYGREGIFAGTIPLQFSTSREIPAKEGGNIFARDPDFVFRDGAKLQIYEKVRVVNNEIHRLEYSYHYEREETSDLIRKPAYHMHVILDLPHFNAPSVNLEIILQLIVANFYSPDVYSRQIIGQEIHLTV